MPVTTADEAAGAVQRLAERLARRQTDIDRNDDYYRGDHKLRFASDQFRNYFSDRYTHFSDNWVGVVADAPLERLEIIGMRASGDVEAEDDLLRVWQVNEADHFSDMAMLDGILHARTYSLVWGNPSDETTPTVTFEHPSQAIVEHDPASRKRRLGLKLWRDGGFDLATLYTPTDVWKFSRRRTEVELPDDVEFRSRLEGGWEVREVEDEPWPLPNPMGVVPLVEWHNRPRLAAEPMSDVSGTIAMQDAINLMWAYLLNTADFASFGQRVVLGAEQPSVPILDDTGAEVGRRPISVDQFAVDRLIWLEDPDAKVDRWEAERLDNFTQVITQQVEHLAAQTRTPHHYLIGKMANLSAEALKAAETGLVMRTREKTKSFGRGARETFRLIALAQGNDGLAAQVQAGTVLWKDVESRSEAQLVDALQKLKAIGFPFEWIAERYGLTPPEIKRVQQMRSAEIERLLDGDATALLDVVDTEAA